MSLKRLLDKFMADPLGTTRNVWRKGVVEPVRYGAAADTYDARRYWSNRFARYSDSLRGPGDEGLSDEENRREYQAAAEQFLGLCRALPVNYATANVLEIGPGTGYYTELLRVLGVRHYLGVDIAGSFLPTLAQRFGGFAFAQADVTQLPLRNWGAEGMFDLIVVIDVIEHIVDRNALGAALAGLQSLLAEQGRLVVAPLMESSQRHLFYVHFWSQHDVFRCVPDLQLEAVTSFRQGQLAALRRPLERIEGTLHGLA
jgi:2-polyprenyl-3-methyl-5-hydroxy-6-metoxy-1,4-benzoquinol methylase